MRWMHLSGEELLNMEEPPRELLKRLRDYDYASEAYYIPTASVIEQARADHGDDFSIAWWGLHMAATSNSYGIAGCYQYFPQLFSGRWTPRAQSPDETPIPWQQRDIDALHASIQRVLNSSLYPPPALSPPSGSQTTLPTPNSGCHRPRHSIPTANPSCGWIHHHHRSHTLTKPSRPPGSATSTPSRGSTVWLSYHSS